MIFAIPMLLILLGGIGLLLFHDMNRPIPDRIESYFTITLPDNARNFGWYDWSWEDYLKLAKFTVDIEDVEPTLQSIQSDRERCLREPRLDGFMPDFYTDEALDWWQPFDAIIFDGVTCRDDYDPDGLGPNYNIMVDYSIPDEATIYIEFYSMDSNGRRARQD